MAMETAGFSGGEADELRRAMGHKRSRDRMAQIPAAGERHGRNGIERDRRRPALPHARRLRRLRLSRIARRQLRAARLRVGVREVPRAGDLCAAILNVQPMGFYSTEVLVNDARRHGVVVRPVR